MNIILNYPTTSMDQVWIIYVGVLSTLHGAQSLSKVKFLLHHISKYSCFTSQDSICISVYCSYPRIQISKALDISTSKNSFLNFLFHTLGTQQSGLPTLQSESYMILNQIDVECLTQICLKNNLKCCQKCFNIVSKCPPFL